MIRATTPFSWRRALPLAGLLAAITLAASCGEENGSADAGLDVVATTTQVADLVRNVGGGRAEVRSLLRPDADPHDYEPRPSDVRAVAEAAVVLRSGGDLDGWLSDVLANAGEDVEEVVLIDSVETRADGDDIDPHWWQDPRNAIRAVVAIRRALTRADPAGRRVYSRRAKGYSARIRRLDQRIASCMRRVPPAERRVVTTHDSLGYFARRYHVRIVGVVLPSLSSQTQASAADVERLMDRIQSERVHAVFPETALDTRLESAIAREAGIELGDPLWADSLGPEGSDGDTYLSALAANADALARGMSAGRVSCAG